MSLNVKLELSADTVSAIQNAVQQNDEAAALCIIQNEASHAVLDAVRQLPFNITPRAGASTSRTPEVNTTRSNSSSTTGQSYLQETSEGPTAFTIFLIKPGGSTVTLGKVRPETTITELKMHVENETNIQTDIQRLEYGGLELPDWGTLGMVSPPTLFSDKTTDLKRSTT